MRPAPFCILLSLMATLFLSLPAAAQEPTLTCSTPAETSGPCTLKAAANPGQHTLTVQINHARQVRGIPVEFVVEEPGRTITDIVRTNRDGNATFSWFGAAGTGVKVTAKATVAGRTTTRVINVSAPATASTQRSVVLVSDSVVYGYEKGQIHEPVTVRVENFGDRCESNVVVFRSYGTVGTGSPDSVRAVLNPSLGGCTASTWWRLGEVVGRQHLLASLADEPSKSLALNAVARALPRLGAGVVSTYDFREYDTRTVTEKKIQVTRRVVDAVTGDTTTLVTDSTARTISVGREEGGWQTQPTLSIDFPFVASLTGVRVSLGAAFETEGRDFYMGMSLLQPFRGVSQEAVKADFHGVVHFGRREVLANSSCDDDGNTADCRSKEKFFFPLGVGVMATFDASALLTALGNIFP